MNDLLIGFTNKFYTLWRITEEDKEDFGIRYHVVHYNYIKNISFDESKVRKAYPGVEIDLSLRGHSSFTTTEKIIDGDLFTYGKYRGDKISECTDYSYMKWYFENGCSEDNKVEIRKVLESVGYYFEGNNIMSSYDWKVNQIYEQEKDEAWSNINGNPLEVIFTSNLDELGDYRDDFDIIYHFSEVKEMWYNGYPYYLPVVNGKSKRIKNKNIKITDYTTEKNGEVMIVNVINFEICK